MRLKAQLQIVGLSLVLVPAICLTLVYGVMMSDHAASTAAQIANAKLGLLENRLAAAFEVLREAGLSDSEYYLAAYRRSAVERFAEGLEPGEGFLIMATDGAILDGAVFDANGFRGVRPAIASGDGSDRIPDALVREDEGSALAVMPALGSRRAFVSWRRSDALDWILAFGYQRSVALAPLEGALAFSSLVSLGLLGAASILMVLYARRVGNPLARLSVVVAGLGEGRIPLKSGVAPDFERSSVDEIRNLAREFDLMAGKLGALTEGLETRVAERTDALSSANANLVALNNDLALSLERQERMRGALVQSEKLAALGQLVAGIAHELNTPLAAIRSAAGTLDEAWREPERLVGAVDRLGASLMESVFALARELGGIETLQRPARVALETRLAAELRARDIGAPEERAAVLADACLEPSRLPAGFAGEPGAAAIDLAVRLSNMPRSLAIIHEATQRASRVIEAFRIYTRQSRDEEPAPIDLAANIEGILPLFAARITRDVEIERRYEIRPRVLGQADKLAQVWTNLLSNALQAMEYKGRIELAIREAGDRAVVSIGDSGPGIPAAIRQYIFTPFFTTKPAGEGTGLGLEISRQIVLEHGGSIRFETSAAGTTFFVELPLADEGGEGKLAPALTAPGGGSY
ncbi:MAG: hypothetical protein KBC36_09840 [Spirochaetia bacterium]|nr:hypothetical protein [Spirochaetia bacterium]